MKPRSGPGSMSRRKVIDEYFLEHRAKLIDIAAFLDRVGRAPGDGAEDYRMAAFRHALEIVMREPEERARKVLESFSDRTTELAAASDEKGAAGAWDRDA